MEFNHLPVLFNETISALEIKPDGIYVDGTVGGAGHSKAIASRLSNGKLIALDRDPDAVKTASQRLSGLPATVVKSNFKDMDKVLDSMNIEKVNGILLDLGVSSFQLDEAQRGFSFHNEAALDMRMSKEGTSAFDIVNNSTAEELSEIIYNYGEEKFARRIAERIVSSRAKESINTTTQLADIISQSVPAAARRNGHPARKTFQALRIAVNDELGCLKEVLDKAFERLDIGGILAIITFHSLEDRIVKQKFKEFCTGCICPKELPVCVCGREPKGELVLKKAVEASDEELKNNPRSRSAKLRAVKKIRN